MQDSLHPRSWLHYFLKVLFTAAMYFILARLSLYFQFEESNATPVWPPAGLALALVLLWGNRIFPGILFGAFLANFIIFVENQTVDYPLAAVLSAVIGMGNTAEAVVGSYLLKKLVYDFHLQTFPDRVGHILRFTLAGTLMALVGSTVGVFTVYAAGIVPQTQFAMVWLTWWLGDFSGILLIASFILIWVKHFRNKVPLTSSPGETFLFYFAVLLTGLIIFNEWFLPLLFFKWPYWIIPILVWGALKFTQRELITALVIYSAVAIMGTVHHKGPFGVIELNESLLALQAFVGIMVSTKLTLNASVMERRRTETKLRKTSEELDSRVKNRTAQLEERNQFVETLLNSSFDSIIVLDKQLRVLTLNKIAKSLLRLPFPENAIGMKITELPHYIFPDPIREDIAASFAGETVHREKFASPISDNYFEIDYIPLKNNNEVYAVMIVGHDITQRIHAEHQIREQKAFAEMLIESSPYLIMALNTKLEITAWNKKSEQHTGISKAEAIGRHVFELFPTYNTEKWIEMSRSIFQEGQSHHFPKVRFQYKDGWGESFFTPLYNSLNEVIGILCITRDVTELVNITTVLEQRNNALVKTNEELSSFAYVASHDLQEPLRKIQIFSKRIEESEADVLSEAGKNYFQRMKNAAERMQTLIEDLLTYSRTGSISRTFERIYLGKIVDEVKDNLRDEINQKKGVILSENLCECNVIPFQFRQLLHNLISNSLKFAKENVPPRIIIESAIKTGRKLGVDFLDAEKEYCHIRLQDNGIGFDPAFKEKIFGLFERLHGKSEYPGTGIGLAIVKKIIDNHNGFITADGVPDEGTTFNIYIPNEE